jgi:hypothetical protein
MMQTWINMSVAMARVILSDTKMRRQWMFYVTIGLLVFITGGMMPGFVWWKSHVLLFSFYLLASLGGALLLMMMALFDMLLVMKAYRREKEQVEREMLSEVDDQGGSPPES